MTNSIRFLFFLLLPLAAQGDSGAREINALCIASGCFSGDLPGLPVEITQSGPYRLTSDLVFTNSNTPEPIGVLIDTSRVELDLGGFTIRSNASCIGALPLCSESGSGIGIKIEPSRSDIGIRDGSIVGMGRHGIFAESENKGLRFENLRISQSEQWGMQLIGSEGEARQLQMFRNRSGGLSAASSITFVVRNSVFVDNGGYGVLQARYCENNVFDSNGDLISVPDAWCDFELGENLCSGGPC